MIININDRKAAVAKLLRIRGYSQAVIDLAHREMQAGVSAARILSELL